MNSESFSDPSYMVQFSVLVNQQNYFQGRLALGCILFRKLMFCGDCGPLDGPMLINETEMSCQVYFPMIWVQIPYPRSKEFSLWGILKLEKWMSSTHQVGENNQSIEWHFVMPQIWLTIGLGLLTGELSLGCLFRCLLYKGANFCRN